MKRLAFLDLDLTLFDYTGTRRRATAAALQAMGISRRSSAAHFIDSILGPHGDLFEDLGFPNFRRAWKAAELFGLVLLMTTDDRFQALERDLAQLVADPVVPLPETSSFWRRWTRRELLLTAARRLGYRTISADVEDVLGNAATRALIDEAVTVFHEHLRRHMRELPGAEAMLERLQADGYETYVVSEGDEEIQQEKLSILRSATRVAGTFVTGACCQSEPLLADLWHIAEKADHGGDDGEREVLRAIGVLYDVVSEYAAKTPTFFRKVLQTLLLPEPQRHRFFREFAWLSGETIDAADDVGLLLVGDRYEKDLLPALQAFENVVTIRLELGKYSTTYRAEELTRLGLPHPTATARSLRRVLHIVSDAGELPVISKTRIAAPLLSIPAREISRSIAALRATGSTLQGTSVDLLEQLHRSVQAMEES